MRISEWQSSDAVWLYSHPKYASYVQATFAKNEAVGFQLGGKGRRAGMRELKSISAMPNVSLEDPAPFDLVEEKES
ncbi:MAG: hypothetical protein R3F19_04810 [Verrucomicrobiales bacterium]